MISNVSDTATVRKAMQLLDASNRKSPTYATFQLTRRCNLRCSYCDFHKAPTRASSELTLEQVDILGTNLAFAGACVVCVSGGEPTIRKDLPQIGAILGRHHFPTLITNGWFMTPQLAESLYASGFVEVSVSVDSVHAEDHDARRGIRGSWQHAIDALQHLRGAARGTNRRVYMNAVLFDDNVQDIEPLLQLSAQLGVAFRLSLYSPHRGSQRCPRPGVAEYLLELRQRYSHFLSLTDYLAGIDEALTSGIPHCQAGQRFVFIDAGGDVYRCVEQIDPPVGNIVRDDWAHVLHGLRAQSRARACSGCWTSTRGSTELVLERDNALARAEFLAGVMRPTA